MCHKFRLEVVHPDQKYQLISASVAKVDIKLLAGTVQAHVRDSLNGEVMGMITELCERNYAIMVQYLDSQGNVFTELQFKGISVRDHYFALDYSGTEPAMHVVTWQFQKCKVTTIGGTETNSSPPAPQVQVPDGEFVTPQQAMDQLDTGDPEPK